jgi:hypothetical protein
MYPYPHLWKLIFSKIKKIRSYIISKYLMILFFYVLLSLKRIKFERVVRVLVDIFQTRVAVKKPKLE